jgi:hypothetical protein
VFLAVNDTVYFSQILDTINKIGRCYQDQDPTSEDTNEIVATDGGTLEILGTGGIRQLIPLKDKIIVLAANGVWSIDGADGSFSPLNVRVSKVSSVGIKENTEALSVEQSVLYLADSGIYSLDLDPNTLATVANNISETTIQSFYLNNIAATATTVTSIYDSSSRRVYWFYSTTGVEDRFNKALVLDTSLGAFFKYSFNAEGKTASPFIADVFLLPEISLVTKTYNVVDSLGNLVVDSLGNQVIAQESIAEGREISLGFITLVDNSPTTEEYYYTFSTLRDTNLVDWASLAAGTSQYEAFLITGYTIEEDIMRKKQAPIIQAAFTRTEGRFVDNGLGGVEFDFPSSCFLSARWDWSDNAVSGKIGTEQQIYRFRRPFISAPIGSTFDNGYPVVTTRSKIRGRGRSLSLKFRSDAGKDCKLIGWANLLTGNSTP